MRNLRLLRTIHLQDSQFLVGRKYCVVNVNDHSGDAKSNLIECFVFTDDLKVYRLRIQSNVVEKCDLVVNLNEYFIKPSDVVVVGYTFLFNYLYIVLSDGHCFFILFGDEDVDVKNYNLNINVKYVSWSPDINRTAIVDDEDVLYLTTLSDDAPHVLCKIPVQNESEEQNPSVNVGWGSIETQFRGTEGKYSKSKPPEPAVQESSEDTTVNICWKQNSTTFALGYWCKSDHARKVKIFDQDGALLNVTKDVNGLHAPIDWCSSRNLITCVQNLPNKKVVCFLEQNALRHGDFQVADATEVYHLRWNSNGSILAIHERDERGEVLSLWTTSNYKWYRKQRLVFSERIAYFQWDFDVPNRLHVILDTGVYRMYEWMFQVSESGIEENHDWNPNSVAVINDKQLNLTPYRSVCQPPSIPHTTYHAPASINAVVFPHIGETVNRTQICSMLLYLSDNRCAFVTEDESEDEICFSFDEEMEIEFETPLELSAWHWVLPNLLYFNWNRVDGHYFCAAHLDLDTKSVLIKDMVKMKYVITAITNHGWNVIVHTEDGSLFLYCDGKLMCMKFGLLESCFQLETLNSTKLIALSEHRNLYVNDNIKWRDIVAFRWRRPFLVLMKMNSQLLIVKVERKTETELQFNEVLTRQVEPKSYLVTVVGDQVLLEMERGNLEMITPRPFSIEKLGGMLNSSKGYAEAFTMLRKQRINLNVLYDLHPSSFLNSVSQIVENVTDPMYLSAFVTELVDENVAKSMFPWEYENNSLCRIWERKRDPANKVSLICDALIKAIQKCDVKKLINPLLAALVRKGNLVKAAHYAIEFDEIESLCHLTDPILAYRALLADYNITSALRIIEHSKLDPSEYLPFLHDVEATDDSYRKFKICDYLENYGEALKFLAECPNKFDECLAYMKKHNLYVHALHVFGKRKESPKLADSEYVQVQTLVADYYFSTRQFEDAGVLYEKVGLYEKAFECYLSVGDWFAASSAYALMDSKATEMDAYKTLYESLIRRGQYVDAAFIAFHYSKNCKQAVDAFLTAKKYCNALHVAKGLRNEGIIEETIHPQLLTDVKNTIEHLQSDKKTMEKYVTRLKNLRENLRMIDEYGEKEDNGSSSRSTKSSDSSTSSTKSKSSTSSTSSEKELRRRERKLWNLKTGNPRELPSLIAVIKDLFTANDKIYPKLVPDLAKALVKTDEIESARTLKVEYSQFLQFLQRTRDEVWPVSEVKEEGGFKDISIRCPPDITNSSAALQLLNYECL